MSESNINDRAEFECLAACLGGHARKVLSLCGVDDFTNPTRQNAIWAIDLLIQNDSEISIASICDVLRLNDKFDEDSMSFVEHAAGIEGINPESAAALVRELASRRRLSELYRQQADLLDAGETRSSESAALLTSRIFSVAAPTTEPSLTFDMIANEMDDKLEQLQAGRVKGYTSGFPTVDRMLMMMHKSEFAMVTGPPSSTKSLAAEKMILKNAEDGISCAAYVLEMDRKEWFERAVMQYTDLISNANKFRGSLTPGAPAFTRDEIKEVHRVKDYLRTLPIFVSDRKFSEYEIHEDIIRRVENDGVEIVVVDQAQLVKRGDGNNRVSELEAISRGFRLIALKYNILVILLSKMNKAGMASAFRGEELNGTEMAGSSAFESDGSIVLSMIMRKPEWLCQCSDEEMLKYKKANKGRPKHPTNEYIHCEDCGGLIYKAPYRLGHIGILKARGGEVDDRIPLILHGAKLRLEEISYEEHDAEL